MLARADPRKESEEPGFFPASGDPRRPATQGAVAAATLLGPLLRHHVKLLAANIRTASASLIEPWVVYSGIACQRGNLALHRNSGKKFLMALRPKNSERTRPVRKLIAEDHAASRK